VELKGLFVILPSNNWLLLRLLLLSLPALRLLMEIKELTYGGAHT
jgi:hypothetical protein